MAETFRLYFGAFYFLALAFLTATSNSPARAESDLPQLRSNSAQFIELIPRSKVPALTFERLDGKLISLEKFGGKVVLLSFWATWCPPCRRELPSLERLAALTRAQRLEIVAASVDRTGKSSIESFLRHLNVNNLPIYYAVSQRIVGPVEEAAPFPLYGMPITYLIDRGGLVIGYVTGEVDWTSPEALSFLAYFTEG
ncbi:TlpA family protein disulfide reductase [Methylocystis sp. MJC1]|jgi:thiol-disulfide isomerase/thioredoxin|uniref:TlpA disulfide reductase family protein n=1 Tax=Methylocystis sp. MJC1 TaxID=2654282 RepID=UPI0013ED2024|nr:TlpA disulfide reductase family protein [Methylocystis sp. MJC1]KAF2989866.1 Thiol:disulfide interchange protein TlpA [Methylocystis sp. MJC1]MBU6528367.1 TlpA family protein disulfide reductase [Methylocystis sp. MJC1]UZX11271.1 TlpA family protein disulfide reductase [Methylocystis sp. MJC1]